MKIDELTQNDKNMDFSVLNVKAEVMDEVMEHWKFPNPSLAMEAGILLLQTFAQAAKQGCTTAYFEKTLEDGKKAWYSFDYIGMLKYIQEPDRSEGSVHSVSIKQYGNQDKASGTVDSTGPNP